MLERIFRNIMEAFFGTPRRIQVVACVALGLYIYCNPGVLRGILIALQRELWPAAQGLLQIAIVIGIAAFILQKTLGRRRH